MVLRLNFPTKKKAKSWVDIRVRLIPRIYFLIKQGSYVLENNIPWSSHIKNMKGRKRLLMRKLFSEVGDKRRQAAKDRIINLCNKEVL